jgi:hypothetical protein
MGGCRSRLHGRRIVLELAGQPGARKIEMGVSVSVIKHGAGYGPIFTIAGTLHVLAFLLIAAAIRKVQPLEISLPAQVERSRQATT